jgi:peptidoglycan/xylan/chitin deacetylase (PgdA/CDA1 family)
MKIILFVLAVLIVACSSKKDPVCLTIDDSLTPTMLDTLRQYNVKVTFFPTGNTVDKALVRQALSEGHSVGNHSFSGKNFRVVSTEEIGEEITLADEVMGITTTIVRPPYGEYDDRLGLFGRKIIMWNSIADEAGREIKGIVLLHQEPRLEAVITEVLNRGDTFSELEKCLSQH